MNIKSIAECLKINKRNVKEFFFSLVFSPFRIKNNKIVFQNFNGRGYGDNPKYICEELLKSFPEYDIIWLTKDKFSSFPQGIKKVRYGSVRGYYELATSKFWVNNVWTGQYVNKRSNQIFIQTWHGAIALKQIEKKAECYLSKEYVSIAKKMGSCCNFILSNSKWLTTQYKNDFWFSGTVIESGLPRLDVLYNNTDALQKKVFKELGVGEECKIILYAPTFRSNNDYSVYYFEFEKIVSEFNSKFNLNYRLVVRLHPNIAQHSSEIFKGGDFIDASLYPDVQELLAVTDILITDFSSLMFELGFVRKKVFLFAKDYDNYILNERGKLEFNLEELPFSFSKCEEDLIKNIRNYNNDDYLFKLNSFNEKLGVRDEKKASENVVHLINSLSNF